MTNSIDTMRSTMQLTDLSPMLDFRSALRKGVLIVSWKGQDRGTVNVETSDRAYHIAIRPSGSDAVCDTLGEAVAYLVPELREIEVTR